jgi:hypothetical protein
MKINGLVDMQGVGNRIQHPGMKVESARTLEIATVNKPSRETRRPHEMESCQSLSGGRSLRRRVGTAVVDRRSKLPSMSPPTPPQVEPANFLPRRLGLSMISLRVRMEAILQFNVAQEEFRTCPQHTLTRNCLAIATR